MEFVVSSEYEYKYTLYLSLETDSGSKSIGAYSHFQIVLGIPFSLCAPLSHLFNKYYLAPIKY